MTLADAKRICAEQRESIAELERDPADWWKRGEPEPEWHGCEDG